MSWTKIEEVVLSSSQASVTLGNGGTLPQTYKTLKLVVSARGDAAGNFLQVNVTFNGINSGYSERLLYGDGSGAFSANRSAQAEFTWALQMNGTSSTASTFSNAEIVIPNYSGTANKAVSADIVNENNATAGLLYLDAALLANTAAITSITFDPFSTANFVSGSTFTLYGLK